MRNQVLSFLCAEKVFQYTTKQLRMAGKANKAFCQNLGDREDGMGYNKNRKLLL